MNRREENEKKVNDIRSIGNGAKEANTFLDHQWPGILPNICRYSMDTKTPSAKFIGQFKRKHQYGAKEMNGLGNGNRNGNRNGNGVGLLFIQLHIQQRIGIWES
ncbi:hypothetical protein MFRU_020g00530 [Monilinia fructicola]|uniref:Uncharacterized protein n=1 Tax=Monilinia fructicola TaxID=38448 RepID=A0A5M9K4C3_MONFR|nr:hypothetical protein EYC84_004784 [Monilinia fructicola]KAG4028612.1 hypothetical protein MFRU_020g00530 [Monilinia fructicola]